MTQAAETVVTDAHMDAAVDWLMRRSYAPETPEDFRAFQAWLDQAPEHREAYAEVEHIWAAAAAAGTEPVVQAKRAWVRKSVDRLRLTRRALAASLVAGVLGLGGA